MTLLDQLRTASDGELCYADMLDLIRQAHAAVAEVVALCRSRDNAARDAVTVAGLAAAIRVRLGDKPGGVR